MRLSKQDKEIAKLALEGKSNREIAKIIGLNRNTVNKRLKKEEIQELISSSYNKLIAEALPTAIDNIVDLVNGYQDIDAHSVGKSDTGLLKRMEHGYDASLKVAQIPGLLPSAQQNIVHATYIKQQTNIIPPAIAALIEKHFGGYLKAEGDIIDIMEEEKIPE